MKDSGVEWIGEIPKEWQVLKLKHLATQDGAFIVDGDWVESKDISSEITSIRYLTSGNVGDGYFKEQGNGYLTQEKAAELACTIAKGGELVFARLNYPMGRACILPDIYSQMVVAVDVVITRLNTDVSKKYMVYVSMCKGYQEENALIARGTTMQRMTRTQLQNVFFPVPPADIQDKIADYLDTQTAEIDASIAKTQESIEEYKKLKQAVITQAVTKGIRPGRAMKDSGVEWIGEIPEGWSIVKMRYLLDFVESGVSVNAGGGPASAGKLGVLKTSCVRTGVFDPSENKEVLASEIDRVSCPVKAGCIIVSRMNTPELVGSCGYVSNDIKNVFLPDRLWQIHFKKNVLGQFMWRYLNSQYVRDYYASIAVGSSSSMQNISQKDFSEIVVANPPMIEQQEIAAYLDEKCAAIDTLIEKKQQIITELEAYKKSLIYEYVTGKKEVPTAT